MARRGRVPLAPATAEGRTEVNSLAERSPVGVGQVRAARAASHPVSALSRRSWGEGLR